MKRERGAEELWSSSIEKLLQIARSRLSDDGPGALAYVEATDLELVCRIARKGLKGYRP